MLKHRTQKKVENDQITGVRNEKSTGVCFTNKKTKINGQSKPSKDCRIVLGNVKNKPEKILRDWGSLGTNIPKALTRRGVEKAQLYQIRFNVKYESEGSKSPNQFVLIAIHFRVKLTFIL